MKIKYTRQSVEDPNPAGCGSLWKEIIEIDGETPKDSTATELKEAFYRFMQRRFAESSARNMTGTLEISIKDDYTGEGVFGPLDRKKP